MTTGTNANKDPSGPWTVARKLQAWFRTSGGLLARLLLRSVLVTAASLLLGACADPPAAYWEAVGDEPVWDDDDSAGDDDDSAVGPGPGDDDDTGDDNSGDDDSGDDDIGDDDTGDDNDTGDDDDDTEPTTPPPPPPLVPVANSHHIVHIADTWAWDSILVLSDADLGPMITSQNKPADLAYERWTQNIHHSWYATGEDMADAINGILSPVGAAPMKVLVDELKTESMDKLEACANRMRTVYPQWTGRWGTYVVNGSGVAYPNLNPAIDALLDADAILAVELYTARSTYCASGNTAYERDVWLSEFFAGTSTQGRFGWLVARRTSRGSPSHLNVLFGVTDTYMNETGPAVFLDRMFYVWVTRSGYRSFLLAANGGAGAWKWDQPYMSNTSRDQAFAESFLHYCVDGYTSSRLGQVSCP